MNRPRKPESTDVPRKKRKPAPMDMQQAYYQRAHDALAPTYAGMADGRLLRRPKLSWLAIGLVVLVGFAIVRRASPVALKTSCTTPAFALSTHSVHQRDPLRYALTGPADGTYVLAVDIATFTRTPAGRLVPVPDPGVPLDQVQAPAQTSGLPNCKGNSYFGVLVPPGQHVVRLFRIEPAAVVVVDSQQLTVTPPKS